MNPSHGNNILFPGMKLPEFDLASPPSQEAKQYLGATNTKSFSLSHIPSKYILIELLSAFCQYCQKQAPTVNRIYQYVQEDPELAQNIKILGIIVLGNQKAGDAFKTAFRVKFPLILDPKMEIFKKLQSPSIPFLLFVNQNGDILLSHPGYLKDADEFYGMMKKIAKNQK